MARITTPNQTHTASGGNFIAISTKAPPNISTMARRQNLLSEGQLAGLLQLDRVEIRELIDAFEDEEVDDAPSRPLI